jgi:hypothetical protein
VMSASSSGTWVSTAHPVCSWTLDLAALARGPQSPVEPDPTYRVRLTGLSSTFLFSSESRSSKNVLQSAHGTH